MSGVDKAAGVFGISMALLLGACVLSWCAWQDAVRTVSVVVSVKSQVEQTTAPVWIKSALVRDLED